MMDQQFYDMLKDWVGITNGYNSYDSITGKLTKRYGISISESKKLESLTLDEALQIHLNKYYNTLTLERFYPTIALALFDTAMVHRMEFTRELTDEIDEIFPGNNEYKALYHIIMSRLHNVFTHNFKDNGPNLVSRILLLDHYIKNLRRMYNEK